MALPEQLSRLQQHTCLYVLKPSTVIMLWHDTCAMLSCLHSDNTLAHYPSSRDYTLVHTRLLVPVVCAVLVGHLRPLLGNRSYGIPSRRQHSPGQHYHGLTSALSLSLRDGARVNAVDQILCCLTITEGLVNGPRADPPACRS